MAIFLHLTSNDENHDHSLCPVGENSWCFYNHDLAMKVPPRSHKKMKVKVQLTEEQKVPVRQVFEELSSDDLLQKCVKGRTQNLNESFNAKIWNKCPKVRFHGKKVATFAFQVAATEHNIGYATSSLVPDIRKLFWESMKGLEMKDKARKRMSQTSQIKKKKPRVSREGYEAGGH